ncbi:DNA adenine methylase [Pectobacterium carotovorum]|uniref:DNA adenine methylase n=1 Tax=Pectobacterium carotovorum TaxID=554 RepID=UPI001CFA7B4E|nr:DNA adenine methylase [Pectobacterium carotovorum]UCZ80435.1 DNA adenine methylase [Pectobacterium carotovorum]
MSYSPLRYPGGKTKLAPHIKSIIKRNGLIGCNYYEPYAGGAGVALTLLLDDYVSSITINDVDFAVYSFWKSITEHNSEFQRRVLEMPVNMETWFLQKSIMSNPEKHTLLDVGLATFFLNRTNRSGILKGGVIGGKNQNGNYKIDARFNKSNLLPKIQAIGDVQDRINVTNIDASELLVFIDNNETEPSFVYLDPPYYVKGQGLYRNFYNHDDHCEIRDILSKVDYDWVVSYDNNEEIKTIYSDYHMIDHSLNYSAQRKLKGEEVIIYSKGIELPYLNE